MSKILLVCLLFASPALAGDDMGQIRAERDIQFRSTAQRDTPTTRFYDSRGNVTGSSSTYGNTTRFYDARGNAIGSATHK